VVPVWINNNILCQTGNILQCYFF